MKGAFSSGKVTSGSWELPGQHKAPGVPLPGQLQTRHVPGWPQVEPSFPMGFLA